MCVRVQCIRKYRGVVKINVTMRLCGIYEKMERAVKYYAVGQVQRQLTRFRVSFSYVNYFRDDILCYFFTLYSYSNIKCRYVIVKYRLLIKSIEESYRINVLHYNSAIRRPPIQYP
uniref:Uncharacterized protein n=1 Tax=Schizaphis graminum TaxID=13262 RepID=A0A2S2NQP5_SCHGA